MTGLNWRNHKIGPAMPCLYCETPALMRDETGRPMHKVCAEKAAKRTAQRLGTNHEGAT